MYLSFEEISLLSFFIQHGTWRWLDNSTAHIQWRLQGEPSGDGNCANTFADGSGLNDMPCDIARPYLCQAKNVLQV